MTAPDVVELGRRAVACPGWRWVAGMLLECGDRLAWSDSVHWHASGEGGGWRRWKIERIGDPERGSAPDLTDAATLGAIEHGILAPLGVWIEGGTVGPWRARGGSVGLWHGIRVVAVVEALEAAPVRL